MSLITKCVKCSKVIHRINHRFCCGIDYNVEMVINTDNKKQVKPIKTKRVKTLEAKSKKKRESKRKGYKTPPETRLAVLERDNNTCTTCGAKEWLNVHHIEHKKHGGTHDMNNLTTLCEDCHAEQHKDEPIYKVMIANIKRRKGQL
ncbi:HNH endonuclease [Bacillus phage Moonbeam]|uniref:HNH homing endonuclease n=1 Tax=Bacillus phage Moonbeam TaxID=1540091 RepID=A0A0A0RSV9_9CAUD|nr:HNH endonuclease [Bacillus phage Moonbeam]YP_009151796.1 HNH endonuclease [Bacillus phage Moonbeam]AIW03400.1 HNH homing endonuclease [Bacillus phage Moonbeam]AIW03631.1 HNH homing endonuclease [Bacillus phage Moonbeam]